MTMQAVVVRRKMETPTAVVATLGIELVTLSSYLECPAVSTYTTHIQYLFIVLLTDTGTSITVVMEKVMPTLGKCLLKWFIKI